MAQSARKKAGKKLLTAALDEFYVFDDDEIENELDAAIIRFKVKDKRCDWRKCVRAHIWGKPVLREKVCTIAEAMFVSRKEKTDGS